MAQFGTASTGITWYADSASNNYVNDASSTGTGTGPYVSKTDNGFYLVRFTEASSGDLKVIAVRSGLEVLSEAQKAITGTVVTNDISTLKTQVTTFITNAASSIPAENTIGT